MVAVALALAASLAWGSSTSSRGSRAGPWRCSRSRASRLDRCASLALLGLFAVGARRRVGVARADGLAVIGVGTLDIADERPLRRRAHRGRATSMYRTLARVGTPDRVGLGVGAAVGVALVTVAA